MRNLLSLIVTVVAVATLLWLFVVNRNEQEEEGSAWNATSTWLLLLIAVGLGTRVWLYQSHAGVLDTDEAVWGLMSKYVLKGDFYAFYWGQEYGGTLEAFLSAPFVALLGTTPLAIRIVPLILHAAACVLTWRLARRYSSENAARLAAILLWCWPAAFVWYSIRARGFYGASLVCALIAILMLLRISDDGRPLHFLVFGAALGIGWWESPQILFPIVPLAIWLVLSKPLVLKKFWMIVPTALLGALPWLWHNLEHHFGSLSLRPFVSQPNTYWDHLVGYMREGLPGALGLHISDWILGAIGGWILYLTMLAGVAWLAIKEWGRLQPLYWIAVGYPFVFAISPYSWFVDEPRYLYLLGPVVAILMVALFTRLRVVYVGTALLLMLGVLGAVTLGRHFVVLAPDVEVADNMRPLITALSQRDIDRVFAQYWVAYRITFHTDERIIATPWVNPRFEPLDQEVRNSPSPAYVFADGSWTGSTFAAHLDAIGVSYEQMDVHGFEIFIPERKVLPEEVAVIQV